MRGDREKAAFVLGSCLALFVWGVTLLAGGASVGLPVALTVAGVVFAAHNLR